MFFKKSEKFKVYKFYIIDDDQNKIDRPKLMDFILFFFENNLQIPLDFDIGGPYGIRKGSSCGIQAFRNKLEKHGHDKYYALSGVTENVVGFELLFNAVYNEHTYSELIIWYNPKDYDLTFEKVIRELICSCVMSYAYELEIEAGYDISTETKIKKGILGGLSVKVSYEHLAWMDDYENGGYRDIFKNNFMNRAQLAKVQEINQSLKVKEIKGKYLVEIGA
ncbi:hypothetical protein N473_21255 [Pseudoalteromonas luteoviolacea CPMOR-1]|uniref:Uncharacterized protein n=1 Tax=Pseudoalteromonas luteoviolacea CPMOR-1 TaxID=1365248 RepID=A0A167K3D0_9GAMM|nr:hypothetical protein [Pseudoalteromonas luteoviolacea]KZN62075.1 hypothetical protein N473_21255 [Pseudoalteromonas luteoviolacea CPMOR-1]